MIAYRFLSKMGIYNIPIDNDSILQAVVTDEEDDIIADDDDDDDDVIADNLKKLKSSLKSTVVGLDLKYGRNDYNRKMLVLSSKTFCLLVSFYDEIPKSVKDFMNDTTICFVGMKNSYLTSCGALGLWNLAARVLKKPCLNTCRSLKTLAGEVGVEWRQPPKLADEEEVASRCGVLFSQEEIEFLIQNAYYTFVTADKLLGSLGE